MNENTHSSRASWFFNGSWMGSLLMLALIVMPAGLTAQSSTWPWSNPHQHAHQGFRQPMSPRIQLALLLDTSSSMDGLIDQAKSQLWNLVNELTNLTRDGVMPSINLALYEYGNDGLLPGTGYIRQVTPMTTDLDLVSEKLFALTTNGGSEYCGQAIRAALSQSLWTTNPSDMRLIFIAGNEPFNQGTVAYQDACKMARDNGIVVSTIFCGDRNTGIDTYWEDGARLGEGAYLHIDQQQQVVHISTPYDQAISSLNQELNKTYVGYGSLGASNILRQSQQDANAVHYGLANGTSRAISKANSNYRNDHWDLVDAYQSNNAVLSSIKKDELPANMQAMKQAEQERYLQQQLQRRDEIRQQILKMDELRRKYIAQEREKLGETATLDHAMRQAVREIGARFGFQPQ